MIKLNMNLPPDIARRFVEDMEAFYAEPNAIKQGEIAARQLHILREHRKPRDPKTRLTCQFQAHARPCRPFDTQVPQSLSPRFLLA
jgi:hypothetical protein